jgi:hypothetical protein
MEQEKIKLKISEEVAALLEDRGVHEEEIKMVIANAETTGEKLYQPEGDRFLAQMRISEASFYVEYSVSGEDYTVHSAYAHKAELLRR